MPVSVTLTGRRADRAKDPVPPGEGARRVAGAML